MPCRWFGKTTKGRRNGVRDARNNTTRMLRKYLTHASRSNTGTKSFGGRGAHYSSEGMEDIVLQNVTLGYSGRKLLNPTTLKIVHSKRYALVGDNGVGKSSLLHRIASGSLPGFPQHANVYLVEQEVL